MGTKSKLPVFPAGADETWLALFQTFITRTEAMEYMGAKRLKTSTVSPMWEIWYAAEMALKSQVAEDRGFLERAGILQAENAPKNSQAMRLETVEGWV